MNGGATTISTSAMSFTRPRNSLTYFTVSATVLYIFQLPAMKGSSHVIDATQNADRMCIYV